MNEITSTDHNGSYTEFLGYQKKFTFSGGNATFADLDSLGVHVRSTSGSSSQRILIYGSAMLEVEIS